MASQITSAPGEKPTPIRSSPKKQRPMTSLLAAATRLTDEKARAVGKASSQDWQADAWELFDLVGEQHFLATTLANRLGQARLFIGRLGDDPTEPPEPVDDGRAAEVFDAFGGSQGGRAQLIARLGINLFIAGDGWLAGIPRHLLPSTDPAATPDEPPPTPTPGQPLALGTPGVQGQGEALTLSDLEWRMLSVSEVAFDQAKVTIRLGEDKTEHISVKPDDVFLVRVWRPHPNRWWQADSPTRASLPVLRELVGLTEHVSAQVDSRLAGAGVFIVPQSAADAVLARTGTPEDEEDAEDPFTEALIEAMIKPIQDRSNASAYVPLVLKVPDEAADKFKHISFASELDAESRNLREEAIRRLALSQDAPPELLLGVGDMNHWGGWLVREETVTTHVEPPLALMCDALTTQFLRPVLIQQGMDVEEAENYVVWYDVSHLIQRPNRTGDASDLYAAGVISDEALRTAAGFSDTDAPPVVAEENDPAITLAFELVKGAPSLAQTPGIPALVEQVRSVLNGTPAPAPAPAADTDGGAGGGEGEPSDTINDVDLPDDDTSADVDGPPDTPPGLAIRTPETITLPVPAGQMAVNGRS